MMRWIPFLLLFAYGYHTFGYALGEMAHTWVHLTIEGYYRHHHHHHGEVGREQAHHHYELVQTLLANEPEEDGAPYSAAKPPGVERLWHIVQNCVYCIECGTPQVYEATGLPPEYLAMRYMAVPLPVDSPPPE